MLVEVKLKKLQLTTKSVAKFWLQLAQIIIK